ncbi:DUF1727 domain-containing protein [Candidatus Dojkabacteria bacterium]|nr:DUF1727 domain-containing protein [Candidatus Dojkabacteria bacterium]
MLILKVFALKTIVNLLNLLRPGSGTALPGLLAERYAPELFEKFSSQLERVILITGTNGKTTTRNLLSSILDQAEITHFSNREGSNMKRGVISTFIKESSWFAKLKTKTAIIEVEEATLPRIVESLTPEILIITNLFRDQLDAYGEVNKTQEYIKTAIDKSPETKLVLNADDPLVRDLAEGVKEENVTFYSIEETAREKFNYEGNESLLKPLKEAVQAKSIEVTGQLHTRFQINLINYELKIPGIFHVYNATAAILAAKELGIAQNKIQGGFKGVEPAFGRGEQLGRFKILLVKNPAGLTLTLDMLKNSKHANILLILNDNIADGRDVSWIWDAEVEKIDEIAPKNVFVSGTRAEDMALRLKYAQEFSRQKYDVLVESDLCKMIEQIDEKLRRGELCYVLPTYTAMNEFRKLLGKKF